MKRWKQKLEVYGRLGLYVYVVLYVGSLATFFVLLQMGVQDRVPWIAEHVGSGASIGGAWLLNKVIQVPRILATLAITPVVARWLGRELPLDVEGAPEAAP